MKVIKNVNFIIYIFFNILLGFTYQIFCDKTKKCSECNICGKESNNYCLCNFDNAFCINEQDNDYTFLSDFLFEYDRCPKSNTFFDICGISDIKLDIGINNTIKFLSSEESNILCYYSLQKVNKNNNNLHITIKKQGEHIIDLSIYLVYYLDNGEIKIFTLPNIIGKSDFYYHIEEPYVDKVSAYISIKNAKNIEELSIDFFAETNLITMIKKSTDNNKTKITIAIIIVLSFFGSAIIILIILLIKKYKCNKNRKKNIDDNNEIKKEKSNLDIKKINQEKMKNLYKNELLPNLYHKNINTKMSENNKCTICLEEFKEDVSLVLTTKCGHKFHFNCFQNFINKNIIFPKCPNCKEPILKVDNSVFQNYLANINQSSFNESNTQITQNTNQNNTSTNLTVEQNG